MTLKHLNIMYSPKTKCKGFFSCSLRAVMILIILLTIVTDVKCWNCICDPGECEALEPSGCPGLGVIVWDPCRCCKVCARTLGEVCGGFSGTCEPGLSCVEGTCS